MGLLRWDVERLTFPRKGVKAPGLPRAWSTVMPMLPKRVSKATFLGRKMVATKFELLNAVTSPVACMCFRISDYQYSCTMAKRSAQITSYYSALYLQTSFLQHELILIRVLFVSEACGLFAVFISRTRGLQLGQAKHHLQGFGHICELRIPCC